MPVLCLLLLLTVSASAYNPSLPLFPALSSPIDIDIASSSKERRIPLRIFPSQGRQPLILFSHGLGGSRKNNAYLAKHWQSRGFHVVVMQHPGSDESVWQSVPFLQRFKAMTKAASLKNSALRVQDVRDVLQALRVMNDAQGGQWTQRFDLQRIGMSGHSFGAVTTQAVSGQKTLGGLIDNRIHSIKAALLLSPSTPRGGNAERCFSEVDIPWMLMTGTLDEAPIGGATVASRLAVFEALPPHQKYQVVFHEAEHSAFSDRALPGDRKPRNPNHHRVIQAFSAAFFEGVLKRNQDALKWLGSDAAKAMLEPLDRYDLK